MDEADAALDSNYAKKLIHLILEDSENCQYWLSSFKE
jgi:chromosome segregation ATPase